MSKATKKNGTPRKLTKRGGIIGLKTKLALTLKKMATRKKRRS